MHFVYILKSDPRGTLYIGITSDLRQRLAQHLARIPGYTKKFSPWRLAYFEGYADEDEARHRERTLKQFGRVYSQLKRRITKSIAHAEKVRG